MSIDCNFFPSPERALLLCKPRQLGTGVGGDDTRMLILFAFATRQRFLELDDQLNLSFTNLRLNRLLTGCEMLRRLEPEQIEKISRRIESLKPWPSRSLPFFEDFPKETLSKKLSYISNNSITSSQANKKEIDTNELTNALVNSNLNFYTKETNSYTNNYFSLIHRYLEIEAIDAERKFSSEELRTYLDSKAWDPADALVKDPSLTSCAWMAFMEGKISRLQFATVCIFKSAEGIHPLEFNYKAIETHSLFHSNGTVNEDSVLQIYATLRIGRTQLMTPAQFVKCLQKLKKLPASERQFLTVPSCSETVVSRIVSIGFFALLGLKHDGPIIIPSAGLMQCVSQILGKANSRVLNFVFGSAPPSIMFRNAKFKVHDIAIAMWGAPTPVEADGHPSPGATFALHDGIYHLFTENFIPPDHSRVVMGLVTHLKEHPWEDSDPAKDLSLRMTLMDRDFVFYRPNVKGGTSDETALWISIVSAICQANMMEKQAMLTILQITYFLSFNKQLSHEKLFEGLKAAYKWANGLPFVKLSMHRDSSLHMLIKLALGLWTFKLQSLFKLESHWHIKK